MLGRALIAFLLLPGVFSGIIPALIVHADTQRLRGTPFGYALIAAGLGLLLWCVRDFLAIGRGTLAPWNPPRRLVVVGLYRFTRNPMYVSVALLQCGWVLASGSRWLAGYAMLLLLAFDLRVVFFEEPYLRKQFGEDYRRYTESVPRWLLRRPRNPTESKGGDPG